jgi:hypothetical protein
MKRWSSEAASLAAPRKLVYKYKGRPERIDQNEGNPFTKMRMA